MKYRFQDNTLPFEERAKDLLSRLTREEKVGMITSQLDDIPRLGIKKTHIGTEIARGVVNRDQKRETTILPQPWGMAAMFDDALMEQRLADISGKSRHTCKVVSFRAKLFRQGTHTYNRSCFITQSLDISLGKST